MDSTCLDFTQFNKPSGLWQSLCDALVLLDGTRSDRGLGPSSASRRSLYSAPLSIMSSAPCNTECCPHDLITASTCAVTYTPRAHSRKKTMRDMEVRTLRKYQAEAISSKAWLAFQPQGKEDKVGHWILRTTSWPQSLCALLLA